LFAYIKALAGRRRDALEGIVSELRVLTNNSSLDVPLIICDAFRPETLVPMVYVAALLFLPPRLPVLVSFN
jgi:hypothetical protein